MRPKRASRILTTIVSVFLRSTIATCSSLGLRLRDRVSSGAGQVVEHLARNFGSLPSRSASGQLEVAFGA